MASDETVPRGDFDFDDPEGFSDATSASRSASRGRRDGVLLASRILTGSYSGLATVGVLLFFLPWVSLQCNGTELISQSGLQLATGKYSENEDLKREMEQFGKEFSSSMSDLPGKENSPPQLTPQFQPSFTNPTTTNQDDLAAWPLAALVPLGFFGVLFGGLLLLMSKRAAAMPVVPLAGSALSILAVFVCLVATLPIEEQIKSDGPGQQMAQTVITVEWTGVFIVTVVLAVLVLGGCIAHLAVVMNTSNRRAVDAPLR